MLKKLRTASLNSEFTGSYKKKCNKRKRSQPVNWHYDVVLKL